MSVMDPHEGRLRAAGLTMIELLVVIGIMAVMMTVVGWFFAMQARMATDLQEEAELHVRLRSVAEAVAQDLTLVGARAISFDDVVPYLPEVDASCGSPYVQCTGTTLLTTIYASSLRVTHGSAADACRWVAYRLVDGTLYRGDTACRDGGDPAATFANTFAIGIDAVYLAFTCVDTGPGDDVVVQADPSACAEGFRAATVTVRATSLGRNAVADTLTLTLSIPNTRVDGGGS